MNDNEEKAKEFLIYVSENIDLLKNNLKKNITLDNDIFDDSFNETIIKIYDSIIKNGTNVKDFKQYFFIASKWTYVLNDNKNKKKKECEIRGMFDDERFDFYEENNDEEEIYNKTTEALEKIKDLIIGDFTEQQADIYLTYMQMKAMRKQTSYSSIAEQFNISKKEVKEAITSIRDYLNENSTIVNEIKRKYEEE